MFNDYLNLLRTDLPENWIITEELNVDWNGTDTVAILKAQTGNKYNDSMMIPIQLIVLTDDVLAAKAELDTFIAKNHNKYIICDFTNFCKQYYYTPVVPTVNTPSGNTLVNQIIMTGTLLVSSSVSDIASLKIDGEQVPITEGSVGYSTDAVAQPIIYQSNNNLTKSHVKKGTVSFTFSCVNKNNNFCNYLKRLRQGLENPNTIKEIEVTFTDGSVEAYNTIIPSYSVGFSQQGLPVLKWTMTIS